MADLDVSMDERVELPPPTSDDKRVVDGLKHAPPPPALIQDEEVFEDEPDLEMKPVIKDEIIFGLTEGDEGAEDEPSACETAEPKPKKKKPPSEKQRAHLKKAREKALATRRANASKKKAEAEEKRIARQKKREEKDKAMIEQEEEDYLASKEVHATGSHSSQRHDKVKPKVTFGKESLPTKSSLRSLTDEQILDLQEQAISNYEVKRKAAKVVKKKEQGKVAQEKKVYESITKAVGADPDDVWNVCFQ